MKKTIFLAALSPLLFWACQNETIEEQAYKGEGYEVSFVTPESGTRGVVGGNGTMTGAGRYNGDATARVTVTPNPGYMIAEFYESEGDNWNWKSQSDKGDGKSAYTYDCPINNKAHVFYVSFKKATVNATLKAGTGGTVSGGGELEPDKASSIKATAETGYTFEKWEVTSGTATIASATSASTTVTPSTDCTITTKFSIRLVNPNPINNYLHYSVNYDDGTVTGTLDYPADVDLNCVFNIQYQNTSLQTVVPFTDSVTFTISKGSRTETSTDKLNTGWLKNTPCCWKVSLLLQIRQRCIFIAPFPPY